QPGVAAASCAIRVIAGRTLFPEVLVVLLGRIELRRRDDLGDDLPLELRILLELALRLLGRLLLRLALVEDRRAVLIAVVAELAVLLERVHVVPVDLEKLLVARLRRIEDDLDGFRVAGPSGGDLLIGRILDVPSRVTRRHRDDPRKSLEGGLLAPETTPGKDRRRALRRSRESETHDGRKYQRNKDTRSQRSLLFTHGDNPGAES